MDANFFPFLPFVSLFSFTLFCPSLHLHCSPPFFRGVDPVMCVLREDLHSLAPEYCTHFIIITITIIISMTAQGWSWKFRGFYSFSFIVCPIAKGNLSCRTEPALQAQPTQCQRREAARNFLDLSIDSRFEHKTLHWRCPTSCFIRPIKNDDTAPCWSGGVALSQSYTVHAT